MQTPEALSLLIEKKLAAIDLAHEPRELYEPISYTLSLGGKRVRPLLLLMGFELFDTKITKALPAALAIEIFHNFTLLHDDLMDKADIRRNQPTVHKKWSPNHAILSGDAMQILSYQILSQVEKEHLKDCLNLFSKTAMEICQGQQMDMNFESYDTVSEADYMEMIRLKTAVLLGCALKMGGMLANGSVQDTDHLYQLGIHLGLAFQLRDDYLDVYGQESSFGKKLGGDILCNKKTFLLIHALQSGKTELVNQLKHWLNDNNFDSQEKIKSVTAIYNQLQIEELCQKSINKLVEKAILTLDQIHAEESSKENLRNLIRQLSIRQI